MRTVFCCFLLMATFAAAAQKTTPDKRFAALDAQLNQLLKDWNAAGFAVAVVEKDKVIYSKGFGYRDIENKLPVTPNTLFAIGSVTKSFTSSLIGLLQKEGKVDYDKPAVQYLPDLHFYNNNMNNSITLRHMMSHQTGLPRHDYSWYFFNTSSRDSLLKRLQYQEPTAGVREKWQYNNFMFTAQGVIAEKLYEQSWEDIVRQKLFTPLNMQRSNFTIADLQKDADAALGYYVKGDTAIKRMPYYNINGMGPAGSIHSTVSEMAAWLITWINSGKYGGKEVLPASYIVEATTPQAIVAPGLPSKEKPDVHFAAYGFGWALSSYRGHYRVEHGGNIDGFSASAAFYPTDSIGIVVLSNQNGSSIPSIVRNILSDRLLNLKPYDWNGDLKKAAEKTKAQQKEAAKSKKVTVRNTKPTHPLTAYEGRYHHPGYGSIIIYTRQDSLFASVNQQKIWLNHNNCNVFNAYFYDPEDGIDTSGNGLPLQFQLGIVGEVESLSMPLEPGLQQPLLFKKQPPEIAVAVSDLKKYEGTYTLAGMDVKVYTKGDKLFLLVPGQPEYELAAGGDHKFVLKGIQGFSVQFTVAGNKATDATFMQPNGNFKATRKE